MAESKPKHISLKLEALRDEASQFRTAMTGFRGTPSARWASTIRWIGTRQNDWGRKTLISEGAFEYAVVILNREFGATVALSGEISSHLIALCHPQFDRRQRSEWSRAVANVLRGRLTVEEAANRGVTAAAAQTKRTAAAKAEAEEKKRISASKNDGEEGVSGLPIRTPVKPQMRKRRES